MAIFATTDLQPYEYNKLLDLFKKEIFPKGHVLIDNSGKSSCLQTVYYIHSGKVIINKDSGVIKSLGKGDYFGDDFIKEEKSTKSTEAIVMEEETECYGLSKDDIISVDRLQKGVLQKARRKSSNTIKLSQLKKIKL